MLERHADVTLVSRPQRLHRRFNVLMPAESVEKFIREIAQTDCRLLIVKKDLPIDGARSDRAASWPKLRSWVASLRICDEHPVGSLPLR